MATGTEPAPRLEPQTGAQEAPALYVAAMSLIHSHLRRPSIAVLIAAALAIFAFGATGALAGSYAKPKAGNWNVPAYFDYVKNGGTMKISSGGKRKISKLVIKLGSYSKQDCGASKIKLRKPVSIRKYSNVNGRYAAAKLDGGLFVPKGGVKFKLGTKNRTGKLMVLFDYDGKLATSARVELNECTVPFIARK